MHAVTSKNKNALFSFLLSLGVSFFAIGIIRLVLVPSVLVMFLTIAQSITQPLAGMLTASTSAVIVIPIIIYVQMHYRQKLTQAHITGIWTGWIIQFMLSFVALLIK